MQPQLTRAGIVTAFAEFDRTLRESVEWKDWQAKQTHKYAIEHDGKLYPVKQIASLASGVPVSKFSGGKYPAHTNSLVQALGYRIIPLRESNPDWARDELIVALDFYLRHRPNPPNKQSQEIIDLSKTITRIGENLFLPSQRAQSFRNANGVYMKLMNFRRLDPAYTTAGKKGLTRGAKAEELVWRDFASDPKRCLEVAGAIIAALEDLDLKSVVMVEYDPELEEAPEGRLLTRRHVARERNRKLIESKRKSVWRKSGKLVCEVCSFDFAARYGKRGEGFIECHHLKALATLSEDSKTHINDLALVCSNCHRMIHRGKPWLTIDQAKGILID